VLNRLAVVVAAAILGVWVWMIPVQGYTECDRSECGSGYTALRYTLFALIGLFAVILALAVGRFLLSHRGGGARG
jgi:hypothetical protein